MPKNGQPTNQDGGEEVKATGVVRKLDALGRVVVPASLRRHFGLDIGDSVEIFVTDGTIVLRKHEPACVFCGETHRITFYRNRRVCQQCRDGLARQPA